MHLRPCRVHAPQHHNLTAINSVQVADAGEPWDFAGLPAGERTHLNDDALVGISFKRPTDGLVVQATEFCERFDDGGASLGRFAFDAREEWTVKLHQFEPNPVLYPHPIENYLGDYQPDGSVLALWQSKRDPWPTNLRCATPFPPLHAPDAPQNVRLRAQAVA